MVETDPSSGADFTMKRMADAVRFFPFLHIKGIGITSGSTVKLHFRHMEKTETHQPRGFKGLSTSEYLENT
ncbi:hypothetical protein AT727_08850 [Desulfitobacterium hafniense]|uniref:Uncharacterized protein n=1 Tax=Desulfitobacterium hafniense TaxID=49338 RepID=A0A0W1JE10_DESHA|nr:hypothetical protein AT727_08850 [Desulfitobacterium hafniense]